MLIMLQEASFKKCIACVSTYLGSAVKSLANQIVSLVLLLLIPCSVIAQNAVQVEIEAVDVVSKSIAVTHNGKSRTLPLAPNAEITIDGKKAALASLLPGNTASVIYDKGAAAVTSIAARRTAIIPAEKLADGWDEIDDRLIFLMVRLASTEASLEATENAIAASSRSQAKKTGQVRQAENKNNDMDRKGGGPVKWSLFYGRTAESFFYHPVDRNTTYHTETILSQQAPVDDNQAGPGVPSRQGLPPHQRPPQFDYIYRANESAKARAENEIADFIGKTAELTERRQRLEAEQAGLWCEVAFRSVSHYDLDKKPLYRFEPLKVSTDSDARVRLETIRNAASFMALALSIVDAAQKDQPATLSKIKPAVAKARQDLSDAWLRIGVDATDRKSVEGKFHALAKKLEESASNLSDSYVVALEGDMAKDQQRKDTFRGLLQESIIRYAEIILALDEMATLMKDDWQIKPDVDTPIKFASLANVESIGMPSLPKKEVTPAEPKRSKKENGRGGFQQQFQFAVEKNIKADWKLQAEDRLWSIENKSLKFSVPSEFPGASIVLRHKLDGDIYIEVYGHQNGGSHLWLHLFGERISVAGEGPVRVQIVRKGNNLQFSIKGVQSSITIKDSVSDLPTGFAISWGLDHNSGGSAWISGVGIKASKGEKDD